MIEAFPSPEARRIEEGETAGEGEKGREGRSQREIRRAACGLLGASQVELELANTGMTPAVPPRVGHKGREGDEGQRSVPIERSGGTRLLRQVCPFVYSDSDASSRSPPFTPPSSLLPSRRDVI